jgi:Acetyl/propionyl-CoA carboxylase, alpha subunit
MNIHVKIGDQIFEVEVGDTSVRPILVKVDCDTYEVWPTMDAPVVLPSAEEKPAASPSAPRPAARTVSVGEIDKKRVVSAPLPGTIISISAMPGMNVKPGQELCVLEAMKMKNAICSTRSGTIAAILVNVNDQVQKGQPLVEYTD